MSPTTHTAVDCYCRNPSPAPPYLKVSCVWSTCLRCEATDELLRVVCVPSQMSYTTAKPLLRDNMQGVFDVLAQSADEIESAFGIETEEDEDSDIDI